MPPARRPNRKSTTPPEEGAASVGVRLSRDLLERADVLAPLIAATDPRLLAVAGDGLTRAQVLRLAIVEGIELLEARHGLAEPPRRG
jgi:hypothetical protein